MIAPSISYSAALMIAGIACLVVASVVWQQGRSAPGATALRGLMLALSWWDITYALFWAGIPGPTPYFWLDITYVAVVLVPTALLAFALQFAKQDHWLRRPTFLIMLLEPALVLLLMWTDPWHGLFFAGKRAQNTGMILNAGPVFWANVGYSYILILIAFVVLLRFYLRSVGPYRRQAAMVLAAVIIPWLFSLVFLLGYSPLPDADITPFGFSLTALAFAYALLRYRLLDLVPIARDALIESMSDGVVVLDARNRIVDLNPAAQRILNIAGRSSVGLAIEEAFAPWPEIVAQFRDVAHEHTEIAIGVRPDHFLDLRISPLHDLRRHFVGRLIVWRDITELKDAQKELQKLATTDMLTQLYNRRYFLEMADHELRRAVRHRHSLVLAMIDIDHFKQINDIYGHPVGDQALFLFAMLCRRNIRDIDILARYGGEEFILLMPETNDEHAYHIAERLRSLVEQTPFAVDEIQLSITVSVGIASMIGEQDMLTHMLQRADQALYAAKQAGRNRTIVADPSAVH